MTESDRRDLRRCRNEGAAYTALAAFCVSVFAAVGLRLFAMAMFTLGVASAWNAWRAGRLLRDVMESEANP